jgi:hypothetical protein
MKIKLKRPHKHDDIEITEVELNLENLTLAEYEKIEREFRALNPQRVIISLEIESGFIKMVTAWAIGRTPEFFDTMAVPDYINIRSVVQGFLLNTMA